MEIGNFGLQILVFSNFYSFLFSKFSRAFPVKYNFNWDIYHQCWNSRKIRWCLLLVFLGFLFHFNCAIAPASSFHCLWSSKLAWNASYRAAFKTKTDTCVHRLAQPEFHFGHLQRHAKMVFWCSLWEVISDCHSLY